MEKFTDNLLLYIKGLAMGAADVVPGVSGGTIAFVTGIYIELINTIKSLNLRALQTLKSRRYRGCMEVHQWSLYCYFTSGNLDQFILAGSGYAVPAG